MKAAPNTTLPPAKPIPRKIPPVQNEDRRSKKGHLPILRGFILLGIVVLLLIPSYLAIFDYIIHKNAPANEVQILFENLTLTHISSHDGQYADAQVNRELLELLGTMIARGDRVYAIPPDFQVAYRVSVGANTGTEQYELYCSAASADLYYTDSTGNCFRAGANDASAFLNDGYAYELYAQSALPVLTTAATDEVQPAEVDWHYRTMSGEFTSRLAVETTADLRTYPLANDIGFTFSVPPTHFTVTITQGGTSTTYHDPQSFSTPQLSEDEELAVDITATYEQDENTAYYGALVYRFRMNVVEAAQFTLYKTDLTEGGFLILGCKNVKNPMKLQISCSPAPHGDPVIFTRGDTVYGVVATGSAGNKKLTVTYGTISDTFDLHIRQLSPEHLLHHSEMTDLAALAEALPALVREKAATLEAQSITPAGNFKDPGTAGFTKLCSVGDILHTEDDTETPLPFELYQGSGVVRAGAYGIVLDTGSDPLLGNYVILHHGCGVCTWYGGLSEIRVTRGDVIATDQEIGVAGRTGPMLENTNTLLVVTTLGNAVISPLELRRGTFLP